MGEEIIRFSVLVDGNGHGLAVSLILGAVALIQKFCGQSLEGFTMVILLQLFSSSVVMISLGIIGYYIARIHKEIKGRPRYIIAETCGDGRYEHQKIF